MGSDINSRSNMSDSNSTIENSPIEEQQQPAVEETAEDSQSEMIETTPIPESDVDNTPHVSDNRDSIHKSQAQEETNRKTVPAQKTHENRKLKQRISDASLKIKQALCCFGQSDAESKS